MADRVLCAVTIGVALPAGKIPSYKEILDKMSGEEPMEWRMTRVEERLRMLDEALAAKGLWARQWKAWECTLMNWVDFRYRYCDCEYVVPYGLVISADCAKHD